MNSTLEVDYREEDKQPLKNDNHSPNQSPNHSSINHTMFSFYSELIPLNQSDNENESEFFIADQMQTEHFKSLQEKVNGSIKKPSSRHHTMKIKRAENNCNGYLDKNQEVQNDEIQIRMIEEDKNDELNMRVIPDEVKEDVDEIYFEETYNYDETPLSRDLLNKQHKLLGAEKLKQIRWLNILFYLIEIGVIILTVFLREEANIFQFFTYSTPLSITKGVVVLCWSLVLILHGIFALMPLFYYRQNFDTIIGERIGSSFIINIVILLGFIIMFSIVNYLTHYIAVGILLTLKIFNYFSIYRKVKYLDEGQYYVGKIEFVCIHIMQSIYGSWLSYCLVFTLFTAISLFQKSNTTIIDLESPSTFLTIEIEIWGILAQVFLICEATMNLAYYKDIFFCLVTALILAGNGFSYHIENSFDKMKTPALALSMVALLFVVFTLLNHFEKAFYLKYQYCVNQLFGESRKSKEEKRIKQQEMMSNYTILRPASFRIVADKKLGLNLINLQEEENNFRTLKNYRESIDWFKECEENKIKEESIHERNFKSKLKK